MSVSGAGAAPEGRTRTPTVFEQQREELVREIAVGMEQVLQNINRLNRNLESIIAVGNEFSSVEALWSQFENFMGRNEEEEGQSGEKREGGQHHEGDNNNNEHTQAEGTGEAATTMHKD
ncbi:DASH complex subunit Dad1-domain-containing protein [Thermoascus aurantiacus ATCC 26904]